MHLFKRENVEVGFTVLSKRVVSIEDVANFAKLSGDFNPIHMDEEFASKSIFKRRVAHGLLIASFISKVLGGEEFGIGSIYLSQTLDFRAPVYIGDTVTVEVVVINYDEKRSKLTLKTTCTVENRVVVDAVATLLLPRV